MDIWAAAARGDTDRVEELLDAGESVTRTRWSGITPLHRAAQEGHEDTADLLLSRGAQVDVTTTWGWYTPLHLACKGGHEAVALLLVAEGAHTMKLDKAGRTPVDWALQAGHKGMPFKLDQALTKRMREEQKSGAASPVRVSRRPSLPEAMGVLQVGIDYPKS